MSIAAIARHYRRGNVDDLNLGHEVFSSYTVY